MLHQRVACSRDLDCTYMIEAELYLKTSRKSSCNHTLPFTRDFRRLHSCHILLSRSEVGILGVEPGIEK